MRQRANSLVIVLLSLATLVGFTSAIRDSDGQATGSGTRLSAPADDDRGKPVGIPQGPGSAGGAASPDNGAASVTTDDVVSDTTHPDAGNSATRPLKMAYLVPDYTGTSALGLRGPASDQDGSREDREFRALVNWVNATGGIGGRRIEARGFRFDNAHLSDEGRLIQSCIEITEDYGASHVIDTFVMQPPSTQQCFAQHGVVLVTLGANITEDFLRQLVPYVARTTSTIDRMFTTLVPQLQETGYMRGAKIGVFLDDTPFVTGSYDRVLKPALVRAGARPAAVVRVRNGDQAAVSNAVLTFRQAGVTHIIFMSGLFEITGFTNTAEAQGYRPRYAFTDYRASHELAASVASPEQLRDAVAVSAQYAAVPENANRQGSADVSSPFDRNEVEPGLRRCLDTLSEARKTNYYRPGQAGASATFSWICDHFLLWLDAVRASGNNLQPASFGAGLRALSNTYPSPRVHATDFGDGRQSGATHFAAGVFNETCKCYPRRTPWRRVG